MFILNLLNKMMSDFLNTYMDFLHESIKRKVNITISGSPKK